MDSRYLLGGRILGVLPKDLRISSFAAVVELIPDPLIKFPDRIAHEIQGTNPEQQHNTDGKPEQRAITRKVFTRIRALHLDRNLGGIGKNRPVDLPDGSGSHGLVVEFSIQGLRRLAKFLDEYLLDVGGWKGWSPVEQGQQIVAVVAVERVY